MLPINIKEECIKAGIFQMSQVNIADVNDYVPLAFMLYRLYHDNKYYNDQSIQAIVNCTTFLEHHQIPYQFSFCCDVFANHANTNLLQGQIDKTNPNFSRIPWQKYVKLTPYEFGLKYDLLSQDNFHLTSEGMKTWADQIKKYLQRKK
jgi:lysophospholipase L1-like esterase